MKYHPSLRQQELSIEEICSNYKLNSLAVRRRVADLAFYYKVTNGHIDAPDILSSFEFVLVGLALRHQRLLKTTQTQKSYVFHGPHNRIANLVNSLHMDVDFYNGNYQCFIANIKNKLFPYR